MNEVCIEGVLSGIEALRFTPAGFPVIRFSLFHESLQIENAQERKIGLMIEVQAVGDVTKSLQINMTQGKIRVRGFLAPINRRSKQLMLHAREIIWMKP